MHLKCKLCLPVLWLMLIYLFLCTLTGCVWVTENLRKSSDVNERPFKNVKSKCPVNPVIGDFCSDQFTYCGFCMVCNLSALLNTFLFYFSKKYLNILGVWFVWSQEAISLAWHKGWKYRESKAHTVSLFNLYKISLVRLFCVIIILSLEISRSA